MKSVKTTTSEHFFFVRGLLFLVYHTKIAEIAQLTAVFFLNFSKKPDFVAGFFFFSRSSGMRLNIKDLL